MKKLLLFTFLIITQSQLIAQDFDKAILINQSDSSLLTASFLLDDGNLLTASLEKRIVPTNAAPLPGLMAVGHTILRKLDATGTQLWMKQFDPYISLITHIEASPNGDILVSGAFYDSLRFTPNDLLTAHATRANGFVASFDSTGNFNWVYSDEPSQNTNQFFYTFDVQDNKVYVPNYANILISQHIRVLNLNGDTIDKIHLADKLMLISRMEFDDSGNLYLCGTADPNTMMRGQKIGNDSIFGYCAFIAKLDSSFAYQWSHAYQYVTIDFYPQMAFNDQNVIFLVDTMPEQNGTGNHHTLKYFDLNGQHIGRDSIGPGFFSNIHKTMALSSFGDGFIYSTLEGFDTVVFHYLDPQFNHTELARLRMSYANTYPWLIVNDSVAYYNHTFTSMYALVNGDTIYNPKSPQNLVYPYQQILLKFSDGGSSTSISNVGVEMNDGFIIYPNPSTEGTLNVKIEKSGQGILRIIGLDGRIHREILIEKGSPEISLSLSGLAKSSYLVSFVQGNKKWTKILVKY